MIHLLEIGAIDETDRDTIYKVAIKAHLDAEEHDNDPAHLSVAKLLRVLQTRADGIKIVGDIADQSP